MRCARRLRRLRSPQIDLVCEIFTLAAGSTPLSEARLLKTSVQRIEAVCAAVATLKTTLPSQANAPLSSIKGSSPSPRVASIEEVALLEGKIQELSQQLQSERDKLQTRRSLRQTSPREPELEQPKMNLKPSAAHTLE